MLWVVMTTAVSHALRRFVDPKSKLGIPHVRALFLHRSVYPASKTEAEAAQAVRYCEQTASWL